MKHEIINDEIRFYADCEAFFFHEKRPNAFIGKAIYDKHIKEYRFYKAFGVTDLTSSWIQYIGKTLATQRKT